MSTKSSTSLSASINRTKSKAHLSKEVVASRRSTETGDIPSPFEFDKFLPWICLQFQVLVKVTVIKISLEKRGMRDKGPFLSKLKESSQVLTSKEANMSTKISKTLTKSSSDTDLDNQIQISAYYNSSGHLAEISIDKSSKAINGKIIKSINICLPFHPALFKISIRHNISSKVLYEIAKLLPHSNITDICLDDCYIPEGNYFILLDYISHLRVLSLKRCRINDMVCKEIAKRIDLGETGSVLSVLDLGSNLINDRGIWYIADVLRRNRTLVHLNLSSNRITDCGLMYLTNHLKEFQMNKEEILGRKKRRFEFFRRIGLSLEKSTDTLQGTQVHFRSKGKLPDVKSKSGKKKKRSIAENTSITAVADAREKFVDIFDDANIVIRDGNMYCIGNLALCSLDLAYNDLDYFSAKRILEVMNYQKSIRQRSHRAGLLRLSLDGNLIPEECDEFIEIQHILLNTGHLTRIQTQRLRSRWYSQGKC